MKKMFRDFWESYLLYLRTRDEVIVKFKIEGLGWLAIAVVAAALILAGILR